MHDRGAQAGQQGGIVRGMDRVVVARDTREGAHVDRGDDHGVAATTTRGLHRVLAHGTAGADRIGQLRLADAATDREALDQRRDRGVAGTVAVVGGDLHVHLDHPAEVGVDHVLHLGLDTQDGRIGRQTVLHVHGVVEVDQVEHALDHRQAVVGLRGAERGEHRRPARADEDVGDTVGTGGQGRRQSRTRDTGMVGDLLRQPAEGDAGRALLHGGQLLARGDTEQRRHGRRRVLRGDDGSATGVHGGRHGQADLDGLVPRERHRQAHVLGVEDAQGGARRGVHGGGVGLDGPLVQVAEAVYRVHGLPAGPVHIRSRQHGVEQTGRKVLVTASGDLHRLDTGRDQLVDGGLLEPVEQLTDGLVGAGDARDGDGARDDADLIGAVARIVGLPQGIGPPPATHVLVDHRHEVHRLARGAAQRDEERDVGRVQDHRIGIRELPGQRRQRRVRPVEGRIVGEQRRDRATIGRVQPGLGTLQHLAETLTPGDVDPRVLGRVGHLLRADGELEVAGEPLPVGHLRDVAEVRLRGDVQRGDDLVAACGHGLGIARDLVEQAARAGRRVVDLVDVRAQLAPAGGHAAGGGAGADPVRSAGGLDEHPLDLGRRGRLEGRHRRGADQDAVERHRREAVGGGPAAGQVVGSPLGGTDATADAQHQVGSGAQLGVGGEQQVVEVLPRVVATGAAALDVDDDRVVRHLVRDADHRADLRDGARLERDVADAGLGQLLDDRDGFLELGDAGGDDHTVERCARGAGPRHEPLATHVQLPQVRVEEHRVELHGAARLEQPLQLLDVVGEDLLGDLTATGELGPVAGVGRGGDDLRIDGGRRHAGQQDRRTAGQARERRLDTLTAVGQGDRLRRECGPRLRHLGLRARGQQVALTAAGRGGDDAHTLAPQARAGHPRQQLTGTQIQDPRGTGRDGVVDEGDPVDRVDEHFLRQRTGEVGVQAAARRPVGDLLDSVGQRGVVETDLGRDRLEGRGEHSTAALLRLPLAGLRGGDLLAALLHARQCGRRTGQHDAATGVADGDDGGPLRILVGEDLGDDGAQALGVDVGDGEHREALGAGDDAAATADEGGSGTDELGDREDLPVLGAGGLGGRDGEHALGVADHGGRGLRGHVEALVRQRAQRGHLGQEHAGQRHRGGGQCGLGGTGDGRLVLVGDFLLEHPGDGVEAARAHHDEVVCDGREQRVGLVDQFGQDRLESVVAAEFLEGAEPRGTLAAEGEGVRLPGEELVDQRALSGGGADPPVAGAS